MAYPHSEIETKWQKFWEQNKTFRTPDEVDRSRPKYYVLDMFPYPSGQGLHVGHPEGYTATDIQARYKRMKGFNVLHPMGWDSFGLPAEQYAIKTGNHPRKITYENIDNFRRQLKMLGFSYDWDREIATTDEEYVRWTQWIFLQIFKRGLAYESEMPVNWSPDLCAVLANEEVEEWRAKGFSVERRSMRQWVLKITEYAERLLADLDDLDWPESIKEMQRNWIGKSEGAEVDFAIGGETVRVFTTRPDTLFGATYMVLAPEHPLVAKIATPEQAEAVAAYRVAAAGKSDLERTELAKEKTGVFTGAYATNPVNGKKIPVWVADYVLWGYGTGAIMAVPAHDTRDFEFANKFGLPIIQVVQPPAGTDWRGYVDDGVAVNSGEYDGLPTAEFKKRITAWLEKTGKGAGKVNYKLRDWLFSRQRFWGEPFPLLHCEKCGVVPVPEKDLPVRLPEMKDYRPTADGQPPLARATEWLKATCPKCGGPARRETNTMPQWAGSCWYYLRYVDPKNGQAFVDPAKEKYWMPVDLYVGGAEHAVLHLLYARFWHKVLFDLGHVSSEEPFRTYFAQGYIQAPAYTDSRGQYVEAKEVVEEADGSFTRHGQPVSREFGKIGKSLKNMVSPDDMYAAYGADTLRVYEMGMGPLEQSKPWETRAVVGSLRFLQRLWRNVIDESTGQVRVVDEVPDQALTTMLHRTILGVREDYEAMRFNTAIAKLIELNNAVTKLSAPPRSVMQALVLMTAPIAPHIAEELWARLGHSGGLTTGPFPVGDPALVVEESVTCVIQIKGKVRDRVEVSPDISEDSLRELVLAREKVRAATADGIRTVIVRAPRLVNVVPV